MRFQDVSPDRTLLVDLAYGEELYAELAALVEAADLESAWVLGSGAVRAADLAFYDQDDLEFESVHFAEPLEMPVFTGTVTAEDVQVRAVLSRPSGQALAGRLDSATVFGGEAVIWGFGEPLVRERDEATGLDRLDL